MADDSGPTEVPHDEPTAAFGPVPDEPTVALNITQMTPDEPATGATGPIDIVPAPEPPRPDRPKQLTIGLAIVAAIVLIVAVVVVSTDGDGAGMSTGTTPFTTSAASTSAVSPASMATASTTVVEPHTSTQPIDPDMPTTVAAPTPFFTASASDFAFNHDGTRIATSSEGGPTTIWDLPSGAARVTLEGGDSNLAFTEDDEVLMAAPWVEPSWGYAQMWSLVDGHHVAGDVLTRDGKFQIRDTDSGGLTLVDVHTGEAVSTFALPGEGIGPRHGSPDGHTYAIQGAATFQVFLVDLLAGQILSRIDPPAGCLIGVNGFSDDGRLIVANGKCSGRPFLMLLDAATGNVVRRLDDVRLLALSPDGSRILTETVNAQPLDDVNVWDTATGNLLHSISIPAALRDQLLAFDPRAVGIEKYFDPAFSRDGRLVARTLVGNAGGPVTIVWSVESESVEFVAWGLGGAKFSPDGTLLAGSRFDIDRPDTPYQVAVYEL